MANRTTPYGAFNFLVEIVGVTAGAEEPLGGFSDVSGLVTELAMSEFRHGNDKENHVRKVPGVHKVGDVTLKRGLISSKDLWAWVNDIRRNGYSSKKMVVITLRDEAGQPVQKWTLRGAAPLKFSGPTFAAKGGGDVAMEELVLSSEALDFESLV